MSNANMYLGNDTGPMHLAALADLDLFVLFQQLQYKPISNKFYLFRNKIDFSNYKSTKFLKITANLIWKLITRCDF